MRGWMPKEINPGNRVLYLKRLIDARGVVRSLVVPLPRGRALRIGFRLETWCHTGPRRYKVVASQSFLESMERVTGIEDGAEWCREQGIEVEGDLKAVK